MLHAIGIVEPTVVIGRAHQGTFLVGHAHGCNGQAIGINNLYALGLGDNRHSQQ